MRKINIPYKLPKQWEHEAKNLIIRFFNLPDEVETPLLSPLTTGEIYRRTGVKVYGGRNVLYGALEELLAETLIKVFHAGEGGRWSKGKYRFVDNRLEAMFSKPYQIEIEKKIGIFDYNLKWLNERGIS